MTVELHVLNQFISAIIPQYTGLTDQPRDTIRHSACTKSRFATASDAADKLTTTTTTTL